MHHLETDALKLGGRITDSLRGGGAIGGLPWVEVGIFPFKSGFLIFAAGFSAGFSDPFEPALDDSTLLLIGSGIGVS
jgi:hypothetical protein